MKVTIIPGFSEGTRIGRRFRRELHASGFHATKDAAEADIIIAHSGGCFLIPKNAQAKLVILVGLPHWSNRRLANSLSAKIKIEQKDLFFIKKSSYNVYQLFRRPHIWVRMWRSWRISHIPVVPSGAKVIVIRNEDDQFLHPSEYMSLAKQQGWLAVSLPGHHDDLWRYPEPYVTIIKNQIKLLHL